jgi:hypothetical protein
MRVPTLLFALALAGCETVWWQNDPERPLVRGSCWEYTATRVLDDDEPTALGPTADELRDAIASVYPAMHSAWNARMDEGHEVRVELVGALGAVIEEVDDASVHAMDDVRGRCLPSPRVRVPYRVLVTVVDLGLRAEVDGEFIVSDLDRPWCLFLSYWDGSEVPMADVDPEWNDLVSRFAAPGPRPIGDPQVTGFLYRRVCGAPRQSFTVEYMQRVRGPNGGLASSIMTWEWE